MFSVSFHYEESSSEHLHYDTKLGDLSIYVSGASNAGLRIKNNTYTAKNF